MVLTPKLTSYLLSNHITFVHLFTSAFAIAYFFHSYYHKLFIKGEHPNYDKHKLNQSKQIKILDRASVAPPRVV